MNNDFNNTIMEYALRSPALLIMFVLLVIVVVVRWVGVSSYKPKKFLNSKAEQNFFNQLTKVTPRGYTVYCKVRLADVIDVKNKRNIKGFNRISRKHIDFVICNTATSKIVACVELDDSSHLKRSAAKRDKIKTSSLKSAGVKLIRVKAARSYSHQTLISIFSSDSI